MIDLTLMASERLRPLKRSEYDRLVELGCFQDESIELLNGMLVAVSPQSTEHAQAIRRLTEMLMRAIGDRAAVQCQLPLGASEESEPEPDVAVVPRRDYFDDHPTSAHLIVEVADSSLRKDRLLKGALYARAGFPEYWIVNVPERVVEVYRLPHDGEYGSVTTKGTAETIHPLAFTDVTIAVADLFPKAG